MPTSAYGQKSKAVSVKKQNKKNRDVKGTEEGKRAQMKEVEDELTKKHMRIQDKATRKRMKQTKKNIDGNVSKVFIISTINTVASTQCLILTG